MGLIVLVVDDSDVMRKIVKRVLGLTGFDITSVFEAGNGDEALMVLVDNDIDLVLTDVNMPEMDGIELLKAMKADENMKHIPVIIISTEGRSGRIQEIMSFGAAGFITKPFRPEDIRVVIQNALGVEIDGSFVEGPENSDF